MGWLKDIVAEDLATLLKGGNLLTIPTNAGWAEAQVGSGGPATKEAFRQYVNTGTTANSSDLLSAYAYGFNDADSDKFNFDKKTYIIFRYQRSNSDAQAVGRVQLKSASTIGALAARGIGIRSDDLALKGESYGTELGVVDLGVTLTHSVSVFVAIVHYPGSRIEWYVNGVLRGTQSDTAKIPGGDSSDNPYLVHSIANGAAGGVDCYGLLGHVKIWQEM